MAYASMDFTTSLNYFTNIMAFESYTNDYWTDDAMESVKLLPMQLQKRDLEADIRRAWRNYLLKIKGTNVIRKHIGSDSAWTSTSMN